MKAHVTFKDGTKMPLVGYGTWQSDDPAQLEASLDAALEAGYRHFDTAFGYNNEDVLGRAMKKWFASGKVKREDLFIVTKLPVQAGHHDRVEPFLKYSLEALQLEYVDLYLVHNPACLKAEGRNIHFENGRVFPDTTSTLEDTWKAMEAQVDAGRCKHIGISNYSLPQVERLVKSARILPANHQVELNAYYPKKAFREQGAKHGITICAFAPLGSPGRADTYVNEKGSHLKVKIPPLLQDSTVANIAKKYGKTPAQILLKYLIRQDVVVIPKSVTPSRIVENFQVFDFELDQESMTALDALDTGKSGSWGFDWSNAFPGIETHPEFQLEIDQQ